MFFHSQRNISPVHLKHTWTPLSRNIWTASVFIMPIRIWWTQICLYCKLLWTTVFRMHGPSPVLFTAIMAKHLSNTEKTVKTPICPIKKEPIWELMVFCKQKIKPFQISILFQKYCWSDFLISIGLLKCIFIPASRHFRISSWYEKQGFGLVKSGMLQFTMGTVGLENPMDKRYFYALNSDGKMVAFIVFVPFLGKTVIWRMSQGMARMLPAV